MSAVNGSPYNYIVNPETNEKILINTHAGKSIISSYLNVVIGGSTFTRSDRGLQAGNTSNISKICRLKNPVTVKYYTGAVTGSFLSRAQNQLSVTEGPNYSSWDSGVDMLSRYCKLYDNYGGKKNEPHFDLNMIVMACGELGPDILEEYDVNLEWESAKSNMDHPLTKVPVPVEHVHKLTHPKLRKFRVEYTKKKHIFIMGPVSRKAVVKIIKKVKKLMKYGNKVIIHVQGGNVYDPVIKMSSVQKSGLFPNAFNIHGSLYQWKILEKKLDDLCGDSEGVSRVAVGFKVGTKVGVPVPKLPRQPADTYSATALDQGTVSVDGMMVWPSEKKFNDMYENFMEFGPGESSLWKSLALRTYLNKEDWLIIQDCSDKDNYTSLKWINDRCLGKKPHLVLLTGAERGPMIHRSGVNKGMVDYMTTLLETKFDYANIFGTPPRPNTIAMLPTGRTSGITELASYWPSFTIAQDNIDFKKALLSVREGLLKTDAKFIERGLTLWFRHIMESIGSENLNMKYIGCALAGEKAGDNVVFNPIMHTDHLLLAYYAVNSIMNISSRAPIPDHMISPTAITLLEAATQAVVSDRYDSDGRERHTMLPPPTQDIDEDVAIPNATIVSATTPPTQVLKKNT